MSTRPSPKAALRRSQVSILLNILNRMVRKNTSSGVCCPLVNHVPDEILAYTIGGPVSIGELMPNEDGVVCPRRR